MTSAFSSNIGQWLSLERDLNPVFVKELRQAVRNRFILGGVNTLLLILITTAFIFLAWADAASTTTEGLGHRLSVVFTGVLSVAALVVVPVYVGAQLAIELHDQSFELMLSSAIGGHRIILGKLYAGLGLVLLACSICFPFLAFSTLLTGVDLFSVLFASFWTVLNSTVAIQAAILAGSIRCHGFVKTIIGVAASGALIVGAAISSMIGQSMLRSGVTDMFASIETWFAGAAALCIIVFLLVFFHVMSIAFVVPNSRSPNHYDPALGSPPLEAA